MKQIVLLIAVISFFSLNGAQKSKAAPATYQDLVVETRYEIFRQMISPAKTMYLLNREIRKFGQLDKAHEKLVRENPNFQKLIKQKKQEIKQHALEKAQEIFDELYKGGELEIKIDLKVDGVDTIKGTKMTPIDYLIEKHSQIFVDLLQALLDAGADPNKPIDVVLATPLIKLIYDFIWSEPESREKQQIDTIFWKKMILLINYGADVNATDIYSRPALDLIYGKLLRVPIKDRYWEVANYLIKHGAKARYYDVSWLGTIYKRKKPLW